MLHNAGALQEGMPKANKRRKSLVDSDDIELNSAFKKAVLDDEISVIPKILNPTNCLKAKNIEEEVPPSPAGTDKKGLEIYYQERRGMFFYTIPEGEKVLVTDKHGRGNVISGPKRISKWGKRIQRLQHYIAYPAEFLIIKNRDGSQTHCPGPREEWLDPRVHAQIDKADALQIAGKEAVVVYAKDKDDRLMRRIVIGPALFVPNPGEWLHTFSWHGCKDSTGYKKVPGGLVFQKLWLMPDQMYHDVEDVCTVDDVNLTIKLMIFFELVDVEKMLENSHDPIGDFINAASSDVIDLVSRYLFDDFKQHTDKLNTLQSYPQLLNRAEQVGYRIPKIVYRGYTTTKALQTMQDQATETRTRLKLERETTEQAQKLTDYKQNCEFQRLAHAREEEKAQLIHDLEKEKHRHQQNMEIFQQQRDAEYREHQRHQEQQAQFFEKLKAMNVDLTAYLTQNRADQVIELRTDPNSLAPHLHLPAAEKTTAQPKK